MENSDIVFEKIKKFCVHSHTLQLTKGQSIEVNSPNPEYVYYLKKGFIRMYILTPCLHDVTIHFFKPKSFFPMHNILAPINNFFLFEAFTVAEVIAIPKDIFLNLILSDSEISRIYYQKMTNGLNKLCFRLSQAYHCTAKGRVISSLFYFSKTFGKVKNGHIYLQKNITHEDIANFSGLTRENTSRILEQLKENNLINIKYKRIVIKDIQAMAKSVKGNLLILN